MLRAVGFAAAALVGAAVLVAQDPAAQSQRPAGSFRTRITMVPVDVRVVDRDGKPITDLRQQDFTVLENGVPQDIRHFSAQALAAEPATAAPTLPLRGAPSDTLSPSSRRIFLIVLGRGRMQGPSKELEGLLGFVRSRLLPQDQVAVLAYNRATDFTTNHARIVDVVERFKTEQTKIESQFEAYFSGLRALYGPKQIPAYIQKEIDAVFRVAEDLRPREIVPGQAVDADRIAGDVARTTSELQRAEIAATRLPGEFLPDTTATDTADRLDTTFDNYVAQQRELAQDLGNIYAGIDYLRYLDGEKHLIFVTPKGMAPPRQENDKSIAMAASDARIAMDIIFTGGVVGPAAPRFVTTPTAGSQLIMPAVPSPSAVFNQTFMAQGLRLISDMTGGQMTAFRKADVAFRRIDEATRFQYLLGYYPANTTLDGKFRTIRVKVNRPGATVFYRRGYYGTPQLVPLDRRQFMTFTRMSAAARYAGDIGDVNVVLQPPVVKPGSAPEVDVYAYVRAPKLRFTEAAGRFTASLDVGIYCGDAKQKIVGELLRTIDLNLDAVQRAGFERDGMGIDFRVPLKGTPMYVKVIVYDFSADLLGSATVRMK